MHLAISGCGQLKHIIADPPTKNDLEYNQWARYDSIVILWILENIDTDLVNQFLDFPTAKALWSGIEILYNSGRDGLQIFDLTVKANPKSGAQNETGVLGFCETPNQREWCPLNKGKEEGGVMCPLLACVALLLAVLLYWFLEANGSSIAGPQTQ